MPSFCKLGPLDLKLRYREVLDVGHLPVELTNDLGLSKVTCESRITEGHPPFPIINFILHLGGEVHICKPWVPVLDCGQPLFKLLKLLPGVSP